MKIPQKIKVGAITYDIEIVEKLDNDELGRTTFSEQNIKIKKGKPEQMEQTFLHELFHCFGNTFEELAVDHLAHRLHAFIKDNPGILK